MSRSSKVSQNEIRAIFRLVGEIRELGGVPEAWRRHMILRLCSLLQIRAGMIIQTRVSSGINTLIAPIVSAMSVGFEPKHEGLFAQFISSNDAALDPSMVACRRRFEAGESFTMCRQEVVPDEVWKNLDVVDRYHHAIGTEDALFSEFFIPHSQDNQTIVLLREKNHPRSFGAKERFLLHLLHTELAHVWATSSRRREDPRFSPRQSQCVSWLRLGLSEKEVAQRMGLSRHTVHDLIKALHRQHGVETRAELMAATLPTAPAFYPAISA